MEWNAQAAITANTPASAEFPVVVTPASGSLWAHRHELLRRAACLSGDERVRLREIGRVLSASCPLVAIARLTGCPEDRRGDLRSSVAAGSETRAESQPVIGGGGRRPAPSAERGGLPDSNSGTQPGQGPERLIVCLASPGGLPGARGGLDTVCRRERAPALGDDRNAVERHGAEGGNHASGCGWRIDGKADDPHADDRRGRSLAGPARAGSGGSAPGRGARCAGRNWRTRAVRPRPWSTSSRACRLARICSGHMPSWPTSCSGISAAATLSWGPALNPTCRARSRPWLPPRVPFRVRRTSD